MMLRVICGALAVCFTKCSPLDHPSWHGQSTPCMGTALSSQCSDMRGMVEAILHKTPSPISSIYSESLRSLVLVHLLNRKPKDRFNVRECLRERFVRHAAQRMLGAVKQEAAAPSVAPAAAVSDCIPNSIIALYGVCYMIVGLSVT